MVCGVVTTGSRCTLHRRTNNSTARGYGIEHQRARAALIEALPSPCWYCGTTITRASEMVAAHVVDGDNASPRVPSHRACNERAKLR